MTTNLSNEIEPKPEIDRPDLSDPQTLETCWKTSDITANIF